MMKYLIKDCYSFDNLFNSNFQQLKPLFNISNELLLQHFIDYSKIDVKFCVNLINFESLDSHFYVNLLKQSIAANLTGFNTFLIKNHRILHIQALYQVIKNDKIEVLLKLL